MDPGPGHDADRPPVPRAVHASRHLVLTAPHRLHPAGAGAPGRRARRGRDRGVAGRDLGEGTTLAAATGAWICFEDAAGQSLRPPKARTWARRAARPWSGCPARAPDGCRWPAWFACGLARGAVCSTGCASTTAARASAGSCPKPTTPGLIAAAHQQLQAPVRDSPWNPSRPRSPGAPISRGVGLEPDQMWPPDQGARCGRRCRRGRSGRPASCCAAVPLSGTRLLRRHDLRSWQQMTLRINVVNKGYRRSPGCRESP